MVKGRKAIPLAVGLATVATAGGIYFKHRFEEHLHGVLNQLDSPAAASSTRASLALPGSASSVVDVTRKEIVACLQGNSGCEKDARALPFFIDGKVVGYKLTAIREGSFFSRLGIRNEDVIVNVNGEGLTSISKALVLMTQLVSAKTLKFGILRDGRVTRIDYRVKD
jgi:hypothetical protein